MNNREVLAAARQSGVKLIRFEYCDVSGVARAKAVHVAQLAHKLVEGVGLTRAQMSINLLEQLVHIDGMEPVGEIRLVPDPATFTVLPWAPASASVLCDQLDHDRRNWGACTRSYLKDMIARAAAAGISVQATFENEYYLAREEDGRFVPVDAPVSRAGLQRHRPRRGRDRSWCETVDALEAQGMSVEQAINEFGPGQREIAIRHTDALRAADQQMKFRDTVRGVAWQHGCWRRSLPSRTRMRSAAARTCTSASGTPTGSGTCCTTPEADRGLSAHRPAVHRRDRRSPAGARRADHAELQLLPAPAAGCLGVGDHGLGLRQQGSRAPGRLAVLQARGTELQHRVQDLRRQREPVPVPWRADRLPAWTAWPGSWSPATRPSTTRPGCPRRSSSGARPGRCRATHGGRAGRARAGQVPHRAAWATCWPGATWRSAARRRRRLPRRTPTSRSGTTSTSSEHPLPPAPGPGPGPGAWSWCWGGWPTAGNSRGQPGAVRVSRSACTGRGSRSPGPTAA